MRILIHYHLAYVFQDLSKLGRDLKHVLIVDNSPASYSFHPENAVSDDIFLLSSYFVEQICFFRPFSYINFVLFCFLTPKMLKK